MTLSLMAVAYARRKCWEAELLAAAIANKIALLFGGGNGDDAETVQGTSGKVYRKTTPEGLMGMMGARWRWKGIDGR